MLGKTRIPFGLRLIIPYYNGKTVLNTLAKVLELCNFLGWFLGTGTDSGHYLQGISGTVPSNPFTSWVVFSQAYQYSDEY